MNFLAHIHIAVSCGSDISGNLLGDFVKGDPAGQYPDDIVQGIKLHRFVDSYTDSHPYMKKAKLFFPEPLRRFAPIALDVFWDHCLAKNWSRFASPLSLADFVAQAESDVKNKYKASPDIRYPDRYIEVTERMWRYNWLESYARLEVIELALQRMSERSRRMSRLAECFPCIRDDYAELITLFGKFYPDVLQASADFSRQTPVPYPSG
ncbi:ACP phosphodiesterase [Vibrio sp. HA2012]|uniref:acyl carrier protein phosphodiesterase n=1 Tax=Vibrio sp. HA2012 TaxID=1971595 RepID=UPI000C2BBAA4|nr:ACP phosphodiesterase [Vibrio sp. HA2012]PJC87491.1 ACP phosphodiesterase [Vibrio sp. HA2012]